MMSLSLALLALLGLAPCAVGQSPVYIGPGAYLVTPFPGTSCTSIWCAGKCDSVSAGCQSAACTSNLCLCSSCNLLPSYTQSVTTAGYTATLSFGVSCNSIFCLPFCGGKGCSTWSCQSSTCTCTGCFNFTASATGLQAISVDPCSSIWCGFQCLLRGCFAGTCAGNVCSCTGGPGCPTTVPTTTTTTAPSSTTSTTGSTSTTASTSSTSSSTSSTSSSTSSTSSSTSTTSTSTTTTPPPTCAPSTAVVTNPVVFQSCDARYFRSSCSCACAGRCSLCFSSFCFCYNCPSTLLLPGFCDEASSTSCASKCSEYTTAYCSSCRYSSFGGCYCYLPSGSTC